MATVIMERTGRLFINLQQIRQVPRMLSEAAPSMPGTLKDSEVPCYFRERYINSGYRPLHQSWRYYFLSLFQRHNETINIWTHFVGALVVLVKSGQLAETVDFFGDPHSWPLFILLLSSINYMVFSAVAHLLASKSEHCQYAFFFLDYIGVAQYQYGSALVHFYYAAEEKWYRHVQGIFMPTAAVLCCLSCLGCCYGKLSNHSLPAWVRTVGQVVPSAVSYAWDTSPVFHRLLSWPTVSEDPAMVFHFGQVVFFFLSAFFFTHPLPERCCPGRCDFLVQSHQVFHVFLVLGTLSQIHASHLDYLGRRTLYSHLHSHVEAALFVRLYVATLVSNVFIAAFMFNKVKQLLVCQVKSK